MPPAMRRRANLWAPRSGRNGSGRPSSSRSAPALLVKSDAHGLVLLLAGGILLWTILCLHIHVQLSGQRFGRLRGRFMVRDDLQNRTAAAAPNSGGGSAQPHHATPPTREGLSACLLVNDENPRLPEWIAYHYHVLPLRALTVAVDPASRSSPEDILNRWRTHMGVDARVWEEKRYMPYGGDGACNASDPKVDCLKAHRKRQQHFIRACLKDFKRRNKTWVLLTDVDEYITFNSVHSDDPPAPLDAPPEGVPMLSNWTWLVEGYTDVHGKRTVETKVKGTLTNLPPEGFQGHKDGDFKRTLPLVASKDDIFYGAYGSVFTDKGNNRWFLRDDFAFRDAIDMTPEEAARQKIPIILDSLIEGNTLRGKIESGIPVEMPTNWREPPVKMVKINTVHGGHVMKDLNGKRIYVKRDTYLWPPHLSTAQWLDMRKRLPTVGDGTTILDVLTAEMQLLGAEYANETIGPCLALPRVYYGSKEDPNDASWKDMAPDGFKDGAFATLRFRWHALPDVRINKYQKTLIDVSRIARDHLRGEAENIHTPVKGYCRTTQPPRYSTSPFRVNHYLDSFEAYSYRNDARADKRQCRNCYDEKGKEAAARRDDDIRPWLKGFVDSVGTETAQMLLEGAGNFVRLS